MCRLLLIFEYATLNGGERSLLALLPRVKAAGFRPLALAPPSGPLAEALAELDIEVIDFPTAKGDRRFSQSEARDALRAQLPRLEPQLVHANSLAMSRLVGPVAAELKIPSLGHLRDIMRLSRQATIDLAQNSRLLAVSQATRAWYEELGIPPARLAVAYNGVDLEVFRPREASGTLHRELGLPAGAPLVGCIGQLGLRKGVDVVLAAASRLAESDVHFLIVGERNSGKNEALQYEDDLRRAAACPPLAGRCHFLGRRDDVPRILNELTLLLHAARQEPLGRVLLEAAAAGTALVATEVGGTNEIFPPSSRAAILVPPDDLDALAVAAARLLADPAERAAQAERARQRMQEGFTIAAAATELVGHYRELIFPGKSHA